MEKLTWSTTGKPHGCLPSSGDQPEVGALARNCAIDRLSAAKRLAGFLAWRSRRPEGERYAAEKVVFRGDLLSIEYRDGGKSQLAVIGAGRVEWEEPSARVHSAENVGKQAYDQVSIFFLERPGEAAADRGVADGV